MQLGVVITTYNRPVKCKSLVDSLLACNLEIKITVVDSGDRHPYTTEDTYRVKTIYTTRKNQPFQRFLGYSHSSSEVLLFLDDDMEIADEKCIEEIKKKFEDDNIIAQAIHFIDKHDDTSLAMIPKTFVPQKVTKLKKAINWFTAYPYLAPGVFGLCGVRGPQPSQGGRTTFVSGGAFAARKSALYQNFNFLLFDLYDQKLGKGEDAITGYTLSKQGRVVYDSKLLFYHNDQKDSAYSIDHFSFARRIAFSRKYLSLEKTRLDGGNSWYAVAHYHWYMLWRTLGLLVNYVVSRTDSRKKLLKGTLKGWRLASKFSFSYKAEPTAMLEYTN